MLSSFHGSDGTVAKLAPSVVDMSLLGNLSDMHTTAQEGSRGGESTQQNGEASKYRPRAYNAGKRLNCVSFFAGPKCAFRKGDTFGSERSELRVAGLQESRRRGPLGES